MITVYLFLCKINDYYTDTPVGRPLAHVQSSRASRTIRSLLWKLLCRRPPGSLSPSLWQQRSWQNEWNGKFRSAQRTGIPKGCFVLQFGDSTIVCTYIRGLTKLGISCPEKLQISNPPFGICPGLVPRISSVIAPSKFFAEFIEIPTFHA